MRVVELHEDPQVEPLLDIYRRMSVASTAQEVTAAFLSRFAHITPVRHMVTLLLDHDHPGQFRIMDNVGISPDLPSGAILDEDCGWDDPMSRPLQQGGIISELIATPHPKIFSGLRVENDPILGREIATMRSGLAAPIFIRGEVSEWVLTFAPGADDATVSFVSMAMHTANLIAQSSKFLKLTEEVRVLNRRLEEQLESVARVQAALLPRQLPTIPGLQIASSYLTSDRAGGDYYDFFEFNDDQWGILIADVSGHGAAAATVMAMLHAILHEYSGDPRSPAGIMKYANQRLAGRLIEGNFVTAFLAIYDAKDGKLRFCRSGHNPPRVRRAAGNSLEKLDGVATIPLGLLSEFDPEDDETTLDPGDTLVLYTDGITEAFDVKREMFGTSGLDRAIVSAPSDPSEMIDSIHQALYAFTRRRDRDDDQTLVVLRRDGA